jgi:alkylated DNA repair protein (DNA oxidative demethylase)
MLSLFKIPFHLEANPKLPGFVILRNWMKPDQSDELCGYVRRELSSGWRTPKTTAGFDMSVKVACFGAEWHASGYQPGKVGVPLAISEYGRRAIAAFTMQYSSWKADTAICSWYAPGAKLGLHVDRQEHESHLVRGSPIVTFSFGDEAVFDICEHEGEKPKSYRISQGDVIVMSGAARWALHGIRKILPGSGDGSLGRPGRLSITLREVWPR